MSPRVRVPWRVKHFVSERFPLAYHLIRNAGAPANDRAHWDQRLAETWDRRTWPTKVDRIARLTAPGDVIVDVACGNGSILRALRTRGYERLHGVEISQYAVARLRTEGITMHAGELPAIPLPDASCDVVIASQILEHVIRRDRFAREIVRVLRPGGRVFVFVPDDCLGPIDEPEHVIKFDARTLRHFLARRFDAVTVESMRDANYPMPILFGVGRKREGPAC